MKMRFRYFLSISGGLFFTLFATSTGYADSSSRQIEEKGNSVLLKGKNYTAVFDRRTGAVESIIVNGKRLTLTERIAGAWSAKFTDGSSANATASDQTSFFQDGDSATFHYSTPQLSVKLHIKPGINFLDFQATVIPRTKTLLEFGTPGSLHFSPAAIDGVVCHITRPLNPGTRLSQAFFLPAAQEGANVFYDRIIRRDAPMKKLFHSSKPVVQNLGDLPRFGNWSIPDGAEKFFDSAACKRARKLPFVPGRPFAPGFAELELLKDGDNVVIGGSRFGGSGAFLRFGGFASGAARKREIMELTHDIVAKLRRDKQFKGKRRRIGILKVSAFQNSRGMVPLSQWEKKFQNFKNDLFFISDGKELAAAIHSPETAVVINPYSESCYAPPGGLIKFMDELRSFVQSGGYWFETDGYSFYYELVPCKFYTTGRLSTPASMTDFVHFAINGENAAVYTVQPINWEPFAGKKNPESIFIQTAYELGGSRQGGYLNRHHIIYVKPGQTWITPVTRILCGVDAFQSLRQFSIDNEINRKLSEKGTERLRNLTARSVLWKTPALPLGRGENIRKLLPLLPTPIIVHDAGYLYGGFDKQYPDHLPPRKVWGTANDLKELIADIHARGMLFMPYTNNTWWCDNPISPTFRAAGKAPLLLGLNGKPVREVYVNRTGWSICMWHPAVRAANDRLVHQFTEEYPVDILFQDQCGSRGSRHYDLNPASPVPNALMEGILSTVRVDAQKTPLATEELCWPLINYEFMACGMTKGLMYGGLAAGYLKDKLPPALWTLFPILQLLAHEKLFLTHHDLDGNVSTPERVSLTLGLGFMMMSWANPVQEQQRHWLYWLDRLQKSVCARYAGGGVSKFEHSRPRPDSDGVIRAVYGPISVTANLDSAPLQEGDFLIAPGGHHCKGDGMESGYLLACGTFTEPTSFVVDGNMVYLYANSSSKAAFPLSRKPAGIMFNSRKLPFQFKNGAICVQLPSSSEKFKKLWQLEINW